MGSYVVVLAILGLVYIALDMNQANHRGICVNVYSIQKRLICALSTERYPIRIYALDCQGIRLY